MDLLRDNVRAVYRKYFLAAFGSALVSCIYGVVDMAMVGQYQGPDGTAALVSCAAFSVFWTALSLAWPNLYIRIFMRPTAAILAMAPGIIRTYAVSFLLLPLNIFSTYYFQAILKPGAAFLVSVARGLVISGGADPAAAGGAGCGVDLVGDAGHGAAGRVLCGDRHSARDAGAADVLKPGLSAYTSVIGGDVHEALESISVCGGVPAADGSEDGRPGGCRGCARGAAAGHQYGR